MKAPWWCHNFGLTVKIPMFLNHWLLRDPNVRWWLWHLSLCQRERHDLYSLQPAPDDDRCKLCLVAFASLGSGCGGCACSLSATACVVLVAWGLGMMPDTNQPLSPEPPQRFSWALGRSSSLAFLSARVQAWKAITPVLSTHRFWAFWVGNGAKWWVLEIRWLDTTNTFCILRVHWTPRMVLCDASENAKFAGFPWISRRYFTRLPFAAY